MKDTLRQLAVLLLVAAAAFAIYHFRVRGEMVDFAVYRQAATRALHAQPLYRESDGHYQFKYLPAFALAMAPAAHLDPAAADLFWFAFSFALVLLLVRWSVRLIPERRRSFGVLVGLTFLFMAKFYGHELVLGQANVLFGMLLLLGLGALDLDAPVFAGLVIGAAVFVKPYAIVFAPWLSISGGRRAIAAFTSVVLAGLALPALVYGWSGNLRLLADWFHAVTATTAGLLVVSDNVSFAAMWAKWLGAGRVAALFASLTGLAAFGAAAWTWWRRRNFASPNYLDASLLLLLVPLMSPQGWDYVLLLATPAVALVLDRWSDVSRGWRAIAAVALTTMGLTLFDVMRRALYAKFMATSLVTVAAIALAAALVNLRRLSVA